MSASLPELEKLLVACHQRDRHAQRRLYGDWYAFTRSVAVHYAKNDRETEEIVQDAFLKLFIALDERPFRGDFRKWYRRIIVNVGIDYYRRYHRYRPPMLEWVSWTGAELRNGALEKLEEEDCARLLQLLPPSYRMVFNLHELEGFSHPEIADRLGISVGTSRSHLAKARRKLKKLVGPLFNLAAFSNV